MVLLISTPNAKSFELSFDGLEGEIDADALALSLTGISEVMHEVNAALDTGKRLQVKVRSFRQGSFVVGLDVVEHFVQGLQNVFNNNGLTGANLVVEQTAILLNVFHAMRGRRSLSVLSKDDEKSYVMAPDGAKIAYTPLTFDLLNKGTITDGLTKTLSGVTMDSQATGLKMIDPDKVGEAGGGVLFEATRDDIKETTAIYEVGEEFAQPTRKQSERRTMNIASSHLLTPENKRQRTWDLIYQGFRIRVIIDDPEFIASVSSGSERFGAGDSLDAQIEITQQYNESAKQYENKSYRITKVYKHINAPRQGVIPLNSTESEP